MKTKPKNRPNPWYWPQRRFYVDRYIVSPQFAVVRNSDVYGNITVFAECESARNAAKIAKAMNDKENGGRE